MVLLEGNHQTIYHRLESFDILSKNISESLQKANDNLNIKSSIQPN
jgi:hypothetical protein